jgi:hypothetical protein
MLIMIIDRFRNNDMLQTCARRRKSMAGYTAVRDAAGRFTAIRIEERS